MVTAAATQPKPARGDLENAIRVCDWATVEALLQRGADPNKESYNVLSWVAHSGDMKVIQLLIDHGAYINRKSDFDGDTALMSAVAGGHIEAVRLLIENGADINIRNEKGQTAQDVANNWRNREEIKQLLKEAPLHRYHSRVAKNQQRLNARARPIIRRSQFDL